MNISYSPANVVVIDNYAYIAESSRRDGGLRVIDISDRIKPVEISSYQSIKQLRKVTLQRT